MKCSKYESIKCEGKTNTALKSQCVLLVKSNELIELPSSSSAVNITLIGSAWWCTREFAIKADEKSRKNREKTALESSGQTGCAAGKHQRVPFAGVCWWEPVWYSCFPHGEAGWCGAGCILMSCTNTNPIVEYGSPVLFMAAAHW